MYDQAVKAKFDGLAVVLEGPFGVKKHSISKWFSANHVATLKSRVTYEDPRYQTLVLSCEDVFAVAFDINMKNGKITRCCICHAYQEDDCVCGGYGN
jgi:hypothetical protein